MIRMPAILRGTSMPMFAALCACGLGIAGLSAAGALLVRAAFDGVGAGEVSASHSGLLAVGLALVGVAAAAVLVAERRCAEHLAQAYVATVRSRILGAALDSDVLRGRSIRRGAAVLRFVGDLGAFRNWIALGLSKIVAAVFVIPGALAVLAMLDPRLAWWPGALVAIAIAAIAIAGPALERAHDRARGDRVRMANGVGEALTEPLTFQALGADRDVRRRLRRNSRAIAQSAVTRQTRAALVRAIPEFALACAAGSVLWHGMSAVALGSMATGTVAAALGTIAVLGAPLRQLAAATDYWRGFKVARSRLLARFDQPALRVAPREGELPSSGPGCISLHQFMLDAGSTSVSLELVPQGINCISSDDTTGATRLLLALGGLCDWHSGDVRLDGQSLLHIRRAALRDQIAIVSPRVPLLNGSLRGNLRRGNPALDDALIESRLARFGMAHWVAQFPAGLDSRITEAGANLSPALRGRAMLMRALLRLPRLLLLDHPESVLDDLALAAATRARDSLQLGIVAVTTSPRLLQAADLALRMTHGAIDEYGMRATLRAASAPQPAQQPSP